MAHAADTSRDPNDRQRAAITTLDRNVAVIAGAGTGKTFVLVRRFVELLARNPEWPISAVVAITFTNRAADEMRSRVRTELESRLRGAETDAERRRWNGLLSQIEAARITTIHGLCSEIVRANAAAAAIDPGFEVLDVTQAALLREDAIRLALAEVAGQEGALTDEERALAINVVTRYGESDIRDALKNPMLLNAELGTVRPPEALHAEWEATANQLLRRSSLPALTLTPPPDNDLMATKYAAAQHDLAALDKNSQTFTERFDALRRLTTINRQGGSAKIWPEKAAASEELRELKEAAIELSERIGAPPDEQDTDAATLLDGWHLLVDRTRYHYYTLKTARAALDYDDLESQAVNVLREASVRERYAGTEFKHVMVDEFQDTNARQWEIVKAVAPPQNAGALFIVGDPKQSIYAFRGADVTVFETARTEITAYGGDVLYLTESFRTHRPLVDALNGVFAEVLRRPDNASNSRVYVLFDESQRLESGRIAAPDAPFIRACGLKWEDKSGDKGPVREARAVAHEIRAMVENRTRLVWRGGSFQPVRYGDVALLLRNFRSRVEIFEQALTEAGIPYITLGGQGFFGRREVRDVISALRALHNPADELSLAAALHSPLFAVSDADLLALRQPRAVAGDESPRVLSLYVGLMAEAEDRRSRSADYDPVVFSADVLATLRPIVGRTPVETLLQALIHETGYMATLAGLPNGIQMRANVEKLVDRARESGLTALNLFVRYLRDMTEAEAKEGGVPLQAEDAVRVTTIHSSKGLEYPVVWLADASNESGGGDRSLLNWSAELGCKLPRPDQVPLDPLKPDDDRKLHPYVYRRNRLLSAERENAESLRLFYVAATRAQDALFISGQPNKDGASKGWFGLVQPLLDYTEIQPPDPAIYAPQEKDAPAPAADDSRDFPLSRALPTPKVPSRLHLSASDITALGGFHHALEEKKRRQFEQRLRRRVLDEQSEPVGLLTYDAQNGQLSARVVGTLIHDALRYGYDTLLDSNRAHVERLIESMAWEQGVTQERDMSAAVGTVLNALFAYRRSALCRELEASACVYRELPFVFQREGHVVHGYIDLLYRAPDGVWTLVDFKTDSVTRATVAAHARTYHLQMAVYAEAVAAQTGTVPRVRLVFLKFPDAPVTLDAGVLQAELAAVPLDSIIVMLNGDAST